jgi:hypothetical protein
MSATYKYTAEYFLSKDYPLKQFDFTRQVVTSNEVFASAKMYDCNILEVAPDRAVREGKHDVWYIPIVFKRPNGKFVPLRLEFVYQMLGSGAKKPQKVTDEALKFFNVIIRGFNKSEVESNSILEPEQVKPVYIESFRNAAALELIDAAYTKLVKKLMVPNEDRVMEVKGQKIMPDKDKIHHIMQKTRRDKTKGKTYDLEYPLYRLKLRFDRETGIVGTKYPKQEKHTPTVYDLDTATEENDGVPQPAMAKGDDGTMSILTRHTVENFVTYKSLAMGTINVRNIIVSSQGFSLDHMITNLTMRRRDPGTGGHKFTKSKMTGMFGTRHKTKPSKEDEEVEQVIASELASAAKATLEQYKSTSSAAHDEGSDDASSGLSRKDSMELKLDLDEVSDDETT